MNSSEVTSILKDLLAGQKLSEQQASAVMTAILDGDAKPEQIGAFLVALYFRTPVASELTGFVQAVRAKSLELELPNRQHMIDVCGTGGDGLASFNVSTCVAFVAAASGLTVAKHGNRAVSSRCGSFDVLEALKIPFAATAEHAKADLKEFALSFLLAPAFHPALTQIAPLRRHLGVRTVFNALGPLLNPVRVGRQLLGVYSEALLIPMAETLQRLGVQEALVVRGEDGSDELSLSSATCMVHLRNGNIHEKKFHPEELGLSCQPVTAIAGGEPQENAALLLGVLQGQRGPRRDVTLMNTAAALVVGGQAESFKQGFEIAGDAIDSGRALALLERMRSQSQSASQPQKPEKIRPPEKKRA